MGCDPQGGHSFTSRYLWGNELSVESTFFFLKYLMYLGGAQTVLKYDDLWLETGKLGGEGVGTLGCHSFHKRS